MLVRNHSARSAGASKSKLKLSILKEKEENNRLFKNKRGGRQP
jgi:hypothetical protein